EVSVARASGYYPIAPHARRARSRTRSVVIVLVTVFPMMPVVVPRSLVSVAVRVHDHGRSWRVVDDRRRGVDHCRRRRVSGCVNHRGLLHDDGLSDDLVSTIAAEDLIEYRKGSKRQRGISRAAGASP